MNARTWVPKDQNVFNAGNRLSAMLDTVAIDRSAGYTAGTPRDIVNMVSVHAQVSKAEFTNLLQMVINNLASAPHQSTPGTVITGFLLGYLVRDEQQKSKEGGVDTFDPAPTCAATVDQLREAGHKFCPDCGIVRPAHGEQSA